jgi:uncharacterized protein (DUF58 family)
VIVHLPAPIAIASGFRDDPLVWIQQNPGFTGAVALGFLLGVALVVGGMLWLILSRANAARRGMASSGPPPLPGARRKQKRPESDSARAILKKIRAIELKTRGLVAATFSGQYRSVFKGRGMNFEEVRQYQPGDEVRAIDWNVTARFGEVHGDAYIKKFTEERELTVMLIVDVSASGDFGSVHLSKRELAAEVACLFAFSAIRNNDKVGLILFSDHVELFIPPKKGRQHVLRMIREVVYFEPQGKGTKPAVALDYANRVLHRRSVVFLISDFQAPDFNKALSVTSRRHDLIAVPIIDPREEELPDVGLLTLEDAETGEQIETNTSDRGMRLAYLKAVDERTAARLRDFRSKRIDAISLKTSEDYVPALRAFFRNRERRLQVR